MAVKLSSPVNPFLETSDAYLRGILVAVKGILFSLAKFTRGA